MNSEQTNERVGAVMIVGGGIGGIQSSLDLAESGFYVYLVEKSSCIGGRMAQLDKTFPTNDCSMCIMGPKLVECGRHLNIEILTLSEVESISGNEGNFKVKIHQHARYIDPDKCTGCGDCAKACPVSIPDEFNMGLGLRKATYLSYPQGVPRVNAIIKKDRAPCVNTCPAGINVQGYVQLIAAGKYREAIQLIRERLPLPGVLGRVCPHPCEFQCRRADVDEAIAIRDLKRFAADQVDLDDLPLPEIEDRSEKVAVVGSGPAGLTVAYYLRLKGYQVTIFEALPVLGGMLRVDIPDYRLPTELLDAEINQILRLGIETQTGKRLGMDFTLDDLKRDGFRAIFLAIGAHLGMKSNVKGEDEFAGVVNAVDFLRDVNLGSRERPGRRVVIIGGGNVAIDAARVARRLGCEDVALAYRRSEKEIPAFSEEIEGALAEGVKFHYLTAPVRVLGEGGRVTGLECVRTELGPPDASGRRRPVPVEGSEFVIDCDGVIPAIGQQIDIGWARNGDALDVTRRSTLVVNQHTMQTSIPHVFAAGDAVTGPATVIEAVAAGHKAVEAIHLYINGEDLDSYAEQLAVQEPLGQDWAEIPQGLATEPRAKSKHLEPQERITSFDEVDLCFSEEEAQREAQRCLNCGVCCECFQCVEACKAEAIDHDMTDGAIDIDVGSIILAPGFNPYDPRVYDTYQYSHFPNVVTSLEFERLLSASGPYGGHLIRPSDEKEPKKIAWIQCVGSRNTQIGAKGYCSGVCCTYAIKQAMIAKEHSHVPLDTAIFYIDVRTHGKDFERYFNRAKEETGIRFIKSRINNVLPGDEPGELKIRYTDEAGTTIREDFDIVVLSIGLDIAHETVDLAKKIGVELDHYNFVDTSSFEPVNTSKKGIYVCGAFEAPKDIPETVA
ncbi:MAG: FAD-dependent oxidoreductase, partial [Desulfobacteraceae bacterium]|nr:FAD-dependent oxidoreductase [Desulfobacteraceae bacterium]